MSLKFMIVMPWGRVGSNLLMDMIRQSSKSRKLNSEKFNQLPTVESQKDWFNEFYEVGQPQNSAELIGSKQSIMSMRDLSAIEQLLFENDVRVIRMRRENLVKVAVSQIRAEQYAEKMQRETGKAIWAVRKGEPALGPSSIDLSTLLSRITVMQSHQDRLMTAFDKLEVLEIEYEQINGQLDETYGRVVEFLDLTGKKFAIPFDKATPDNLRDAIENFEEVEAALSNTPFSGYLYA